jgi:hypothetical protein
LIEAKVLPLIPETSFIHSALAPKPYVPAGLVRISNTVKNQRYDHFFFPHKKKTPWKFLLHNVTQDLERKKRFI